LQESEKALVEVRKKRKAMVLQIKEDSLKDREALEQKLVLLDEIGENLEKEFHDRTVQLEDRKLADKNHPLKVQIFY